MPAASSETWARHLAHQQPGAWRSAATPSTAAAWSSRATSACGTTRESVYLENSDGTVSDSTIYFPTTVNITNVYGFRIVGSDGHFVFTQRHDASLGNQSNVNIIASIESVTNGPIVFSKCNFGAGTSAGNSWGFSVTGSNAPIQITDTSVKPASNAGGGTAFGLQMTAGVAHLERSQLLPAAHAATFAIDLTSSTVEIYDSFIVAGANNGNQATAVRLNASQLTAANSTFEGGGAVNAGGTSAGIEANANSSTFMTNNLISGGYVANQHLRVWNSSGSGTPFLAANWHNNYLWYPAPGGDDSGDSVATVATGGATPDANGNIAAGNASCYDPAFTQPDYHIATNSGVRGTPSTASKRADGTTITSSTSTATRALQGAAVDIGAHEVR